MIAIAGVIVVAEGCEVKALRRTLRAGGTGRYGRQDRPDLLFRKDYERNAENLKMDVPVLVKGMLRAEEDSAPKLCVSSIQALEDVKVKLPQNVRIRVTLEKASDKTLIDLKQLIADSPGPGRMMISLEQTGDFAVVLEPALTVGAGLRIRGESGSAAGKGAVQSVD